MVKRALYQDIYREMKKTKARVLSIFMMSALGVAFFSGVRAAEPDMLATADRYMDTYELADLRLINTLGFDAEAIQAIEELDGVSYAEGSQMTYMLAEDREGQQEAVQLFARTELVNQMEVTKGRLPEAEDEVLIDRRVASHMGIGVGDTLRMSTGTEADVVDTLVTDTFRVTGIGNSPLFIGLERGSTTIGNGAVTGFVITSPEAFVSEYDSILYVVAEGTEALSCYSKEYEQRMADLTEQIEEQLDSIGNARYERLRTTVTDRITEGEQTLAEKKAEAQEQLTAAKKQLEEAAEKLAEGRQEFADNEQKLEEGRTALEDGARQLEEAKAQLAEARTQASTGEMALTAGEITMQTYKAQIAQAEARLAALKALYPSRLVSVESIDNQLAEAETQLAEGKQQLLAAQAEMEQYKVQIAEGKARIASGEAELAAGEAALIQHRQELEEGEAALEEGRRQLEEGEAAYRQGLADYEEGKKEAETQIAEAEEALEKAKNSVEKIKKPDWYVWGRESNTGFTEFSDNAASMGAIGKVFPLIFFLVAALVSLTTMTRMVEEQRTQIGTMKALGYAKGDIILKYVFYAMSATIGGSLFGMLIGQKLFPWVIITAYGIMYNINSCISMPYQWDTALLSGVAAVGCNLIATLASCMKALRAMPASLMRPEAPREGKRVFLEYIPFLWKRMSFTRKAAVRNLFRYKKRFFMTLFGIGGCMALLVVGWGLRDSIVHIADLQYENVQLYDGMLVLDPDATDPVQEEVLHALAQRSEIETYAKTYMKTVDISGAEDTLSGYLCVTPDPQAFARLTVLENAVDGSLCTLSDSGVILTEQLAQRLGVKAGDTIAIGEGSDRSVEVKVDAVVKNYIIHYVYLSEDCYRALYGTTPEYSTVLYQMEADHASVEKEVGEELLQLEGTYAITYVSDTRAQVESMLAALNLVVVVLIVSAGLLAYVVLYNLNNINITERRRELATLKVLGFYDMEVSAYVYRENIVLSILGIGLGIFLGKVLHQFIMGSLKVNQVMFTSHISVFSYGVSALLTMVFACFVNYIMYYRLKEIDMVESLKNVD
ncbi:MAG: ABC transporter permease [Lachnospiraceae bacterium]|nr:ABC transporter permease [Lachnospiraceae bacterium]